MSKRIIELGSTVRDVVSGFTGIATARAEHLHLCDRYTVSPMVGLDGKIPQPAWIDIHALEVVAPPSEALKKSLESMKQINSKEETPKVGGPASFGEFSF